MSNNTPTFGNGKICYLEIPAFDIEQSAAFYKEVFGWVIRNDNAGNISFDDAVGEVSGMWVTGRKIAEEPGILISIMVKDIAETLRKIVSHGGSIETRANENAPEVTARFNDPAGNLFCLYQSSSL